MPKNNKTKQMLRTLHSVLLLVKEIIQLTKLIKPLVELITKSRCHEAI